jgi:hypothetical protein
MSSQGEWTALHQRYYRRMDLYELYWIKDNISLDRYRVISGPLAAPIAIINDDRAMIQISRDSADRLNPKLRIYTAAGRMLSSIPWQNQPKLINWAFLSNESLCMVMDNCEMFIYSIFGERIHTINFPAAVKSAGIAEAHFSNNTLVIRCVGSNDLYVAHDLIHHAAAFLHFPQPNLPQNRPPTAMAVLVQKNSPSNNNNRPDPAEGSADPLQNYSIEVYLATDNGSVVVVDNDLATDLKLTTGAFARLAISPNNLQIATFSDDGTLYIYSIDFHSVLSKFATASKIPPLDMKWCGNECIALYWDKILLLVGLEGEFIKYSFDSPLHLIAEIDGLRVISNTNHSFISPVPSSTESIFQVGSTAAAARLYDANESYENSSAGATELIKQIEEAGEELGMREGENLKRAINECLAAACAEFHTNTQTQLLRAASYGKLFCPQFNADKFVDSCKILRVLNQIRHSSVGLPITFEQYSQFHADFIIERLINRHNHLLATKICDYLNISSDSVLIHWACAKITAADPNNSSNFAQEERKEIKVALSDEELAQILLEKLRNVPNISYSSIASVAFRYGRRNLATSLLEYEALAADQIPLLLAMKEEELALDKAISCGDSDLIYLCVISIMKAKPTKEFYNILASRPLARNLYINYCKQTDLESLKKFYYHLAQPTEAATVAVLEAYQCENFRDRLNSMRVALDFYEKDKKDPFTAKITEEQLKLLQLQAEHEQLINSSAAQHSQHNKSLIDCSLSQVLEYYVLSGDSKRAAKLKQQFKVDDKRMWQLEVKTLAAAGLWAELFQLVSSYKKAPPIGFLPIVEICVEYGNAQEALKYIEKLSDYREAMEWLCNLNYWREAAELAAKNKDLEALMVIQQSSRNSTVQQLCEKLKMQLQTQK